MMLAVGGKKIIVGVVSLSEMLSEDTIIVRMLEYKQERIGRQRHIERRQCDITYKWPRFTLH